MSLCAPSLHALLVLSCLLLLVLSGAQPVQAEDADLDGKRHLLGRTDQLLAQYKERLAASRPRTVIFLCDHSWTCGGLADRIKGFVSTFVLALLLDASFSASWEVPVRPLLRLCRAQACTAEAPALTVAGFARSPFEHTSHSRRACFWMPPQKR